MINRFLIVLLLSMMTAVSAQDSLRIFFFGHSLLGGSGSEVWRTAEFRQWAREQDIPMYVRLINGGTSADGRSLYSSEIKQSWTQTALQDTIGLGNWDYVIWNDLYTYTWDSPRDTFLKYTELYVEKVKSVGAIPVIYDDWHIPRTDYVLEACGSNGAYIAPINHGYLWVKERYPYIKYTVDGAHTDYALGYLAGVTTWIAALGQKPFGLSAVYAAMDTNEAHLMRHVAWNAVVDTPFIDYAHWPSGVKPKLVKRISFEKKTDTLDQLVSQQLYINTVYENDSSEGLTRQAIFRSLTPSLVNVSHSGVVFTKLSGVALIEALREKRCDTMTLVVRASLPAPDSLRIVPHAFPGFVEDGFRFNAMAYFTVDENPMAIEVTGMVNWYTFDSVLTITGGKIQRKTGQAGGGTMFAASEFNGSVDTVYFSMMPELAFLKRINFQGKDTVYHQSWQCDFARVYGDSVGFGWLGSPQYFDKTADSQAIRYSEKNFLTHSFVKPLNAGRQGVWGTFKIDAPDNWYIIKAVMGDHNSAGAACSLVYENVLTFTKDTLVAFTGTPGNLLTTVVDSIEVHGMDGIHLSVFGPIQYLVVCTQEGVDMDSISFDGDEYITGIAVRDKILLVDFGASAADNVYGLPDWNRAIKDGYAQYTGIGPSGICGASSLHYNFMGVVGTAPYVFNAGDTIESRFYNNTGRTLRFRPKISFVDSGRIYLYPEQGVYLDSVIIAPFEFGVGRFVFGLVDAGSYRLINIAPGHGDVPQTELVFDKIELIPAEPSAKSEIRTPGKAGILWAGPNPFNPYLKLSVARMGGHTPTVTVYDVRGKVVRSLYPKGLKAGACDYEWDGKDAAGSYAANGVYLFLVKTGSRADRFQAVLLR